MHDPIPTITRIDDITPCSGTRRSGWLVPFSQASTIVLRIARLPLSDDKMVNRSIKILTNHNEAAISYKGHLLQCEPHSASLLNKKRTRSEVVKLDMMMKKQKIHNHIMTQGPKLKDTLTS